VNQFLCPADARHQQRTTKQAREMRKLHRSTCGGKERNRRNGKPVCSSPVNTVGRQARVTHLARFSPRTFAERAPNPKRTNAQPKDYVRVYINDNVTETGKAKCAMTSARNSTSVFGTQRRPGVSPRTLGTRRACALCNVCSGQHAVQEGFFSSARTSKCGRAWARSAARLGTHTHTHTHIHPGGVG
jgi:hypothetical protein